MRWSLLCCVFINMCVDVSVVALRDVAVLRVLHDHR